MRQAPGCSVLEDDGKEWHQGAPGEEARSAFIPNIELQQPDANLRMAETVAKHNLCHLTSAIATFSLLTDWLR